MSLMIEGGRRLSGDLTVQGAKNSVLPILAACILSGDVCILQRCPHLEDVDTSIDILRHLGCAVRWNGPDLEVDSSTLTRWDIPDRLMRRMRSSVVFLGAILARCGQAELSYPGGCAIGARPIDLHLSALRTLGACIREEGGSLDCTASGLAGAEIVLSIPSVGATENAMLAACAAAGDFCLALYNPSSKGRADYLAKAVRILLAGGKAPNTVCGTVRNIGRPGQTARLLTLAELEKTEVDMFTTVFVGNAATKAQNGKMVTPRGYHGV